jgi:Icc-related predicted phosphoesterase
MTQDFTIFFSSDVHGSEKCWMKFINAAKFYGAQALVMGGDITGKAIVPIVQNGQGNYTMEFLGKTSRLEQNDLPEAQKRVRFNGFYPYICDAREVERLEQDHEHLDKVFKELMSEQLRRWLATAQERLEPQGIPCFVMPGNDDDFFVDEALNSNPYVINPDMQVVCIGPYQMLSCSWTPTTPWRSPRECSEEELLAKLRPLIAQLRSGTPAIFNLHSPPYHTGIDEAPELRADFSVVTVSGRPKMMPVGSHAVRQIITEVQPLVALHGHIHESRGVTKIGRTVCVNPGSTYGEGVLDGCLVTLRGDKVRQTQIVRG